MKKIILAILTLLLTTNTAIAAPQPLDITQIFTVRQNPVEQESPDFFNHNLNNYYCTHNDDGTTHPDTCVYNNTTCVWDVDDNPAWAGNGYLNAGSSTQLSICAIADGYDNFGGDDKTIDVQIFAPTKNISVSLLDNLGHSWTPVPVIFGTGYKWIICNKEQEIGPWDIIDNSNNGTGRVINYTLTISASKKTNSIDAKVQQWGIGFYRYFSSSCPN